jgi:hypothetical protein
MLKYFLFLIIFIICFVPLSGAEGAAVDIQVSGSIDGRGCGVSPSGVGRCPVPFGYTITGPDFSLTEPAGLISSTVFSHRLIRWPR